MRLTRHLALPGLSALLLALAAGCTPSLSSTQTNLASTGPAGVNLTVTGHTTGIDLTVSSDVAAHLDGQTGVNLTVASATASPNPDSQTGLSLTIN